MNNKECHFMTCRYNKDDSCISENDYNICIDVIKQVLGEERYERLVELEEQQTEIECSKGYEPMCIYGHDDCIHDCNYIKFYHPHWYETLGRPTECRNCIDGDMYDDEDK